jgi:CHAT domain-containing protein
MTYIPSAGAFVRLRRSVSHPAETISYAGFGRSKFGDGLPDLTHVEQEIRQAAEIFGERALYRSSEARESDLYRLKDILARARILHFATHTVAKSGEAALVLNSGDGEDGLLTETEIVRRIHLSADVVVLSACDTARLDTEDDIPGESFSGLARALFAVGARKLLVTQWRTSDEAASYMAVGFLRSYGISGDPSRALRDAQEQMRARPGTTTRDWGGWILVGD